MASAARLASLLPVALGLLVGCGDVTLPDEGEPAAVEIFR